MFVGVINRSHSIIENEKDRSFVIHQNIIYIYILHKRALLKSETVISENKNNAQLQRELTIRISSAIIRVENKINTDLSGII